MNNIQKIIKIASICFACFLIATIFSLIFSGLSWITDFNFSTDKQTIDFEEIYQGIEKIEIDVEVSNIIIEPGNQIQVTAHNINKNFSSKTRNNTLKIKEDNNWFQNKKGTITITIPTNSILKELDIDTGAGKLEIKNITAQALDIDHGAGLLTIEHSNFSKTEIDGGAGEIKVNSTTFQNLELNTGVGRAELDADITNYGKIECGIGELDLTLLRTKEDYTIKANKGVGNIKINGENQQNNTTSGTGNSKIELEGGVGNIKVSFNK